MMLDTFVIYSDQIGVINPPEFLFNDVKQHHLDQGFSWRLGGVTFFVLALATWVDVQVHLESSCEISTNALRVMKIPYRVNADGQVGILDPSGKPHLIDVAPGNYALFFEVGLVDEERAAALDVHNLRRYDAGLTPNWFRFTFVPVEQLPTPKVLRADLGLHAPTVLVMDGQPVRTHGRNWVRQVCVNMLETEALSRSVAGAASIYSEICI